MLNSDLMSGASLEALALLLVSSYAIAESALGEALLSRPMQLAAFALSAERDGAGLLGEGARESTSAGVAARRRAEAARSRGLSRCLSRARVRSVIRIRGRR